MVQQLFLKGFSGDVASAQARASMVAGEGVTNIRTIAAFNAEERVVKLFEYELEAPLRRGFLRGQVCRSHLMLSRQHYLLDFCLLYASLILFSCVI